jgi:predicted amidophosphoribosyltransferase
LLRVKNTKKQAHLDEHERQENILGAFKINLKIKIPKRVLLIDDVMTTGSTLHEAAQTLQQAGVEVISIICLMYRARRV